jgi:hypothetical protein
VKFGCCCCAGGTPAWPYDVEPPELLPPLLLVGEAHGSLGVGMAVLDGSAVELADGVGESSPTPRWSAPGVGLRLSSGTGSDVEDGDAVLDADPDGAGDALDCAEQRAFSTGLGEALSLDEGVGEAELSDGAADGLSEGRSDGLGPPPSANAVAATDAKTATVAAPSAADLRVIDPPPTPLASPPRRDEKRAFAVKPDVHCR